MNAELSFVWYFIYFFQLMWYLIAMPTQQLLLHIHGTVLSSLIARIVRLDLAGT